MGKIAHAIFFTLSILFFVYFLFMRILSWQQGYSWGEMDWNLDGKTSIAEFFSACDTGKRYIESNKVTCVEYYAYKDGLPIKTVCHENISQK